MAIVQCLCVLIYAVLIGMVATLMWRHKRLLVNTRRASVRSTEQKLADDSRALKSLLSVCLVIFTTSAATFSLATSMISNDHRIRYLREKKLSDVSSLVRQAYRVALWFRLMYAVETVLIPCTLLVQYSRLWRDLIGLATTLVSKASVKRKSTASRTSTTSIPTIDTNPQGPQDQGQGPTDPEGSLPLT